MSTLQRIPRILLSSGEPAGIGPELIAQIAQENWPAELVVIADPALLTTRAKALKLPLKLLPFEQTAPAAMQLPSQLKIIPLALNTPSQAGHLNKDNAAYVMRMLDIACKAALNHAIDAIVTAPVHKGILNEAGFAFQGHTELFADCAGVSEGTVMMFVMKTTSGKLAKVALTTIHIPLAKVAETVTSKKLETSLRILQQGLRTQFKIADPTIFVCGLNPHAGEGGYIGREEIEIISPTLDKLRKEGFNLIGPLSADTIFTSDRLEKADVILAMYHDQALPVVKCLSFGKAVNVTLGLPFVRTSVDHGTALDLAGQGKADAGSLRAAIDLAIKLS